MHKLILLLELTLGSLDVRVYYCIQIIFNFKYLVIIESIIFMINFNQFINLHTFTDSFNVESPSRRQHSGSKRLTGNFASTTNSPTHNRSNSQARLAHIGQNLSSISQKSGTQYSIERSG